LALAIDALLGIGANRAPQGQLLAALQALHALRAPCLSVDVPTGLDALTGVACDGATVRARATLSLLACKPGLHTGAGRDFAGDVWFDDLGIDTAEARPARAWPGGKTSTAPCPPAPTPVTRAASVTSSSSAARGAWAVRRGWPRTQRLAPARAARS
jgi:hypothetical protein